MKQMKQSKIPH